MNKERRKQIQKVIQLLQKDDFENISVLSEIESIRDDEQDYLDNMPENLQSSSRADKAQEAIDNLEEAINELEDDNCDIEIVIDYLKDTMM